LTKEKQLRISRSIIDKAEKFNFEPFFVAGVIATESAFRPSVVSHCKARGLMQITDNVSIMMDVENPYDIEQNIYAGTKYLKMLRQRFGKEELVLAAYNAGPTRVARLQRIPRIRETICYVKRVIRLTKKLDSMFQAKIKQSFKAASIGLIAWGGHSAQKTGGVLTASRSGIMENSLDCDGPRRLLVIQA
jgi:soluble lytic murein transglycosylase-like protein